MIDKTFHCKFPETCMENRKTREDLTKANTDLMFEIAELKAEVEGLTANNANLVEKNAFLRQRPDLPVDRIPAYTALQTKVYEMIKVMEAARDDLLMRGDIDSQGCRVVNMSATTWNNFCDAIDKAALKEGE